MNQPAYSDMPPGVSRDAIPTEGGGIPVSAALRMLMGVGFLAVGLVQGIGAFTGEAAGGIVFVIDGVGFFLLAGTGITMLMDRFYSLYLLLLWAVLGVVGSFIGEGELALPALFARIMVGLVALAAIGQRKTRTSG
jgi:hypothetical protein